MDNTPGINFRRSAPVSTQTNTALYRSGSFSALSDFDNLQSTYHIKSFFDLRSHDEFEFIADSGISHLHFPLTSDVHLPRQPEASDYLYYYQQIIKKNSSQIATLLNALLQQLAQGSCLIGCYAGKDRTGVICYLIHRMLETPIEEIATDYNHSSKSLLKAKEFFSNNAIRKKLSLDEYCQRFSLCPSIFNAFHQWFDGQYPIITDYCDNIGLADDYCMKLKRYLNEE